MPLRISKIKEAVQKSDKIITPQLERYLMARGEMFPLTGKALDFIRRQLEQIPRDRRFTFSASSSGTCYRAQELGYLGVPSGDVIDPQLRMIFEDGHWRHLRWQAMLLDAGIIDTAEFDLPWPRMRSWATIDGLGTVPEDHPHQAWRGSEFGFELKGANEWVYNNARLNDEIKERHLRQVHRAFLSGGFDLYVIIYEDKNTQTYFEWVIEPDQDLLEEQREELRLLNSAIDAKKLHPMLPDCRAKKGNLFKKDCPYGGVTGPCAHAGNWPTP